MEGVALWNMSFFIVYLSGMNTDMKHFSDRLIEAIEAKGSFICVGLDPQGIADADGIFEFNKKIIDDVHDLVPAVKLQSAFYELYGSEGVAVFEKTISYARSKKLLTIADVKRNDVGHSAEAYANAYLGSESFNVDALTVTPYLGWDGVKPFVDAAKKNGRGVFVLVKTSNPSSGDIQDLETRDGLRVFEVVGRYVDSWGADDLGERGYSCVGAVVGATFPKEAARLRALMPHAFFLMPGYGTQ